MALQVKLAAAVSMMKSLGYAQADDYGAARMKKKLEALPKALEDGQEPDGKEEKKLLKAILKELKGDGELEVVDDSGKATKEVKADDAPAKKAKKAAAKAAEPEEDEDEEEEDEEADEEDEEEDEEEEEEKPAAKSKSSKKAAAKASDEEDEEDSVPVKKKGPPKKAGGQGGPGIIASIVEFLQDATEKKPVSKSDILDKLCERFPDHERASMQKTVNVQVPNRIKADKGLDVRSAEKDGKKLFWINPDDETSAKKAKKSK